MMDEKSKPLDIAKKVYEQFLERKKMYLTRERKILIDQILDRPGHFSADELLFDLQKEKIKVSRATIYRTLSQLVEAGILSESDFGHGHTHYEFSLGEKPHVHFIDTDSGEVKETASKKLEEALEELAKKEGFTMKRFKIQVFGQSNRVKRPA